MVLLPHDVTDLALAPVVLAVEARIEELSRLDREELESEVAAASDSPDWTAALRAAALVRTVQYLVDCHDWVLSWHPRGVRVSHGSHHVVLGVPATFTEYVQTEPQRRTHGLPR